MEFQRTRIEKAVQEVVETKGSIEFLVEEFKSILESNIPYEQKCDVISNALISIDNKIAVVDEQLNYLKEYKTKLKEAKALASITCAQTLKAYGISKIEGNIFSSITTTSSTKSIKLELNDINEDAFIEQGFYTKVLDKSAILESYKNDEYIDFINANASVVQIETTHPSKIRVNRRRGNNIIGDAAWVI